MDISNTMKRYLLGSAMQAVLEETGDSVDINELVKEAEGNISLVATDEVKITGVVVSDGAISVPADTSNETVLTMLDPLLEKEISSGSPTFEVYFDDE